MFATKRVYFKLAGVAAALAFSAAASATNINGAGSTFAYPSYTKWAAAYHVKTGNDVNYQGVGSGAGIKQIEARTVDFAGTDAPLTEEELVKNKLVQFPSEVGAATIVVNLPGIRSNELKLDGATTADIFRGAITKWNDPRIAKLNPGLKLPNKYITICHRSDGSGTTFVVSHYLASHSAAFKQDVGAGKIVNWPSDSIGGKGNPGVAANVKKISGAIGYADYPDAKANHLTFVKMKNQAGNFVAPTQPGIAAAAAYANFNSKTMAPVLLDKPGPKTWPIVSGTWVLAPMHADASKQEAIRKFFTWSLNHGQKMTRELGYVPLPHSVVKLVEERMKDMK